MGAVVGTGVGVARLRAGGDIDLALEGLALVPFLIEPATRKPPGMSNRRGA